MKCACNLTWRARTAAHRRSRKGEWGERKTPIGTYFCPQPHKELRPPDCPKSVGARHAEIQVWGKLYEFVMNPDFLLAQAKELLHELQQNYEYLQKTQKQLFEELQEQFIFRQQVITEARKARRDDDKFDEQMSELSEIEEQLKRKLSVVEKKMETFVGMDWGTKINDYVAGLQAGIEEMNSATPQTPEEQHRNFLLKKELVDELVEEAIIDGKRDIQVQFRVKIIDLEVSKRILDFPNNGEIVARM